MINPDPPVDLTENTNLRSFFDVAFVWQDGANTNGSPIVDYDISVADGIEADASFTIFQANIPTKSYTVTGLTPGNMYQFKVKSRNTFGLSLTYSNTYTVLCAYVPSKPDAPTTLVIDDYVLIDWEAPFNGGKIITGYKIYIRQTENIYSQNLVDCDGSTSAVTQATQC
jgi:hypothetical protein